MGCAALSPYDICWAGSSCPAQIKDQLCQGIQCQVRKSTWVRGWQENTVVLWSSRKNYLVRKEWSYSNAHISLLGYFQSASHFLVTPCFWQAFRHRQAKHTFDLCPHWIRVTGSPEHIWTQEYPVVIRNVPQHYSDEIWVNAIWNHKIWANLSYTLIWLPKWKGKFQVFFFFSKITSSSFF